MKDAKSKALNARKHKELVKRFKKGEVGGQEVFEHAMKIGHKAKYDTRYPL